MEKNAWNVALSGSEERSVQIQWLLPSGMSGIDGFASARSTSIDRPSFSTTVAMWSGIRVSAGFIGSMLGKNHRRLKCTTVTISESWLELSVVAKIGRANV